MVKLVFLIALRYLLTICLQIFHHSLELQNSKATTGQAIKIFGVLTQLLLKVGILSLGKLVSLPIKDIDGQEHQQELAILEKFNTQG